MPKVYRCPLHSHPNNLSYADSKLGKISPGFSLPDASLFPESDIRRNYLLSAGCLFSLALSLVRVARSCLATGRRFGGQAQGEISSCELVYHFQWDLWLGGDSHLEGAAELLTFCQAWK